MGGTSCSLAVRKVTKIMTTMAGETYIDDRLFVLSVCRCTVAEVDADMLETIIYHEEAPPSHIWCVATFRNTARYPLTRVDHFQTEAEARRYMQSVEPSVPRVSLGGASPSISPSYNELVKWKTANHCREYDYRRVFLPGGSNARPACQYNVRHLPSSI